MDIRCWETFVAVAEKGSFSAGADALFLSQSVVSKDIQRLEKELGIPLFDRSRRQIALTPAGARLLPQAKVLLNQYRGMLDTLKTENPLRIGMLPVADQYGFAQILARYAARYPEHALRLIEGQNTRLLSMLSERELDGAFCRLLPPFSKERNYICLQQDPLVLLTAKQGTGVPPSDLRAYRNFRFCFLEQSTGLYEASMNLCRDAGFVPDICYVGSSHRNIIRMIREHQAVALLARGVAAQCMEPELTMVSLSSSAESCLVFAWNPESRQRPEMAELLDVLRENN